MIVYKLRAIPGAAPWLNGRTDTQTETVVVAPDEAAARELAAHTSGSETPFAWSDPGSITVEVISWTSALEVAQTIMTDCS